MAESIYDRASAGATSKAAESIRRKIPSKVKDNLPLARKLAQGDANPLLDAVFERFGINGTRGGGGGLVGPSKLLGGLTLSKVREMYDRAAGTDWAKKNLWFIRVTNIKGDMYGLDVNLFATDLSYSPITITGEAVHIGSGSFDTVSNSERVELRVTTLDDTMGSVKAWFYDRHDAMCHRDGTFGLPVDYLFKVEVMQAFIDPSIPGADQAHVDSWIMRPGSIEIELSRRDDALSEVSMTFVQFDTFTGLT